MLNILFVDDDENILAGFRSMLHSRRKEWKCRYASTSAQALELVDAHSFDVVMVDMRMPGMDGADLLAEVEKRQPDTIRIILSGYSEMQALLKSVMHAHQFLSKPCSSDVVVETILRVTRLRSVFMDQSIRTVVTRLGALPAMPELFIQISRELDNPEPDLKRVAKLVEQDMGMAATLMRVANSTFFGFYEKVSTPARAIVLLGTEALKGLVLGVHLLKELNVECLSGYSIDKLWNHSLQAGYFARAIASQESKDDDFIDSCFVVGFLHDIGKLVLVTQLSEQYRAILDTARDLGGPVMEIERQALGVTHGEIGGYLLGLWGFGEPVVKAVYNHHSLRNCSRDLCPSHVVHVANALQHELAPNDGGYEFSVIDEEWLKELGLDDHIDDWRAACAEALEDPHEH